MNTSIRKSFTLLSLLALVAMPLTASAAVYGAPITIDNPLFTTSQYFGSSVAIDGNKFVVSSPGKNSAYLYNATTGTLLHTFNNVTGRVSISGDKVLIGNYLFDATTGTLLQTFNPPPESSGGFGASILSGDKVLIGAPEANTGANRAGSAYLFDATTGTLLHTFSSPTPIVEGFFGASVSISGDNVLISAPAGEAITTSAGSTYRIGSAYLFSATTGALLQTFKNPNPVPGNGIQTLAVSGDKVVISYSVSLSGDSSYGFGRVYLFDATTGAITGGFGNPFATFFDNFGTSLSISGDKVLIGSDASRNYIGSISAGSAYLYDIATSAPPQTFKNPTPASSDQFGSSVSISGDKVLIGAPLDHVGSFPAGRVYLYNPQPDTDGDGIADSADNCPGVANSNQADTDADSLGNVCDSTPNGDTDGDGVDNLTDNCRTIANTNQLDNDSDGLGNACDPTPNGDTDNDGIDNLADNCPTVANPDQADTDGDGIGNVCDSTPNGDTDGDGIDNLVDNCPAVANAGQEDTDSDGIGNLCDPTPNGDTDNDGVDNLTDNCPIVANSNQTDTDADGIGNACDTTPNGDTDNDGVDNLADNCPAVANPDQADTDNDGIGNACDLTPPQEVAALVDLVEAFNLQQGIANNLDAKLSAALNALNDVNANNNQAAINSLQAFISSVEAQRGNKITNEQANTLIATAQAIINTL